MTGTTRRRRAAAASLAAAVLGLAAGAHATETPPPAWVGRLEAELGTLEKRAAAASRGAGRTPRFGVFVRDLESGAYAAWRAEDRWYWASMVKLPVAVAVLRGVERGEWTLETPVTVRPGDYVDGAGPTAALPVGTPATVRWLLEQMMGVSDNTASDMLIDLVGLAEVNATLQALVPEGSAGPVTTLADVRRAIWDRVAPGAGARLRGRDLLALRALPGDAERLQHVARLLDLPPERLRPGALDRAYDGFLESGANAGRLDAYGAMLKAIDEGRALSPASTRTLIAIMERSTTGQQRLLAGLPTAVRFAHKTGTQRRRVCDAGIARWSAGAAGERRAVVVACTRDEPTLERAEATLARIGHAVCKSGLFGAPATEPSRGPAPHGTTAPASFVSGAPALACPVHAAPPLAPAASLPLPRGGVVGGGR